MSAANAPAEVESFLYEEAWLIDSRRWKEWLELFVPDCRFWMPAWKADDELVEDPDAGLSFIYYESRSGLEDRVTRALSGLSVASTPLPRTCHQLTNVRVETVDGERLFARCAWSCHVFEIKSQRQHVFFGHYEHVLVRKDGTLRIASKKITLLNDLVPAYLDFYHV